MKIKPFSINPLSEAEIRRIGNLLSHAKTKAISTLLGERYVNNEFNYIGTIEFPELSFLTYNNKYVFALGTLKDKRSIFRFPRERLDSIGINVVGRFDADDLMEVLENEMPKELLQLGNDIKLLPKKRKYKKRKPKMIKKKDTYLCKEFDEEFVIEASSLKQAKEDALIFGAVVIKKLTDKEVKKLDIKEFK